ncbi:anaerobic sulfatase maturase [Brevibacillus nitrificans]|uniref:anaerobic sulfatase maturase n=1 Tax=Brevibacillus nitrificans TaxID=651560 RepID=UPI002621EFD1|nr:anaerobic sulfatase maturase [Brevibacillus nitrificans]
MNKQDQFQQGFHILAKPIGPLCNLNCEYCFYTEKEALFPEGQNYRMSETVLEAFIQKYIASQNTPEISFVWQGGEPTLMGLDFFRKVIELQNKYKQGKTISNSLQTNGTLLTREWREFLAQHDFLVGLSLDGPEDIHDHYRVDRGGKPTFHKVLEALTLLKTHGVQFNVLACVTRESSKRAIDVYRFLKEQGVEFIQFIPIVERKPDATAVRLGLRHAVPPALDREEAQQMVGSWTVEPEAYGDFLIQVFDEWVRNDVGSIHVMNFEWALSSWMGLPPSVCIFSKRCGSAVTMEHNGDLYSCDHYVYPDYRLGNVVTDMPSELMALDQQAAFGASKETTLPKACQTCEVRFACHGECPKHRFLKTPDGEPGLNYLCAGYKKYFRHIHPYMKAMVQLLEHGLPAAKVMDVIRGPLVVKLT